MNEIDRRSLCHWLRSEALRAGLAAHKVNSYFLELPEYMASVCANPYYAGQAWPLPRTGLRHHMGVEDFCYEEEKCCCNSLM